MKTNRYDHLPVFFTVLLAVSFTSCGPDEEEPLTAAELERRQELAFDLAGNYLAAANGDQPTLIAIENEHKTHDVRAVFTLGRDLTDSEKGKVASALQAEVDRIDPKEVDRMTYELGLALQKVTLGEGDTQSRRGGENVVLDAKGETSEIALASKDVDFYEVKFSSTTEVYTYSAELYLTAYKAEQKLDYRTTRNTDSYGARNGEKGMFVSVRRTVKDSLGYTVKTSTFLDLPLVTGEFARQ